MARIEEITTVCYVGAGTMGSVNSLVAAIAGYDTVLYDLDAGTLEQVRDRQREFADFMVATGFCTEHDVTAAFERIRTTTDAADAAARADLVSESVVESVDVKRSVHAQFDALCPPHTILTTNTSALLVSDIEDAVARGERFAALHSHMGSLLVDIVGGPRTTPDTIDVLRRYVLSLNAIPLVMNRESPGYIVNALLGPLLTSAAHLVVLDLADVATVDSSWMVHSGAPMGPFAMLDMFGLDMVLHNWQNPSPDDTPFRLARRAQTVPLMRHIVDQGHYGMKTGKGFYDYPEPAYQSPDFADHADATVHDHLLTAVAVKATLLAADDIADPIDIDRAWIAATSLPIGPFGVIDQIGVDQFLGMCVERARLGLVADDDLDLSRAYLGSLDGTFYTYPDPEYTRPDFVR